LCHTAPRSSSDVDSSAIASVAFDEISENPAFSATIETAARLSLHDGRRRVGQTQFGKDRLEARFVAQRIETAIPDPWRESTVGLGGINLQLIQGPVAFSQRYEIECVRNRVPSDIGIIRRSLQAVHGCGVLGRVGHATGEQSFGVSILTVEFA